MKVKVTEEKEMKLPRLKKEDQFDLSKACGNIFTCGNLPCDNCPFNSFENYNLFRNAVNK